MKTYEITATLHDGRVVVKSTTHGIDVLNAIIDYFSDDFEQDILSQIKSITVKEV